MLSGGLPKLVKGVRLKRTGASLADSNSASATKRILKLNRRELSHVND